jgi:hypothetical protein
MNQKLSMLMIIMLVAWGSDLSGQIISNRKNYTGPSYRRGNAKFHPSIAGGIAHTQVPTIYLQIGLESSIPLSAALLVEHRMKYTQFKEEQGSTWVGMNLSYRVCTGGKFMPYFSLIPSMQVSKSDAANSLSLTGTGGVMYIFPHMPNVSMTASAGLNMTEIQYEFRKSAIGILMLKYRFN